MKSLYVLIVLAGFCFSLSHAYDMQIGNSSGATLAYLENVKLSGIPLTQREKNIFYSNERNQVIRAITARDLNNSKAKPTVIAGGVGSTFVNIKIKSERGKGLNYQVQIFQ